MDDIAERDQRHELAEAQEAPELETQEPSTDERDRLELEVMKLRDTKGDLPETQYYTELETLLRQIARIYERLDRQ